MVQQTESQALAPPPHLSLPATLGFPYIQAKGNLTEQNY